VPHLEITARYAHRGYHPDLLKLKKCETITGTLAAAFPVVSEFRPLKEFAS
jgi:hypothetical protein